MTDTRVAQSAPGLRTQALTADAPRSDPIQDRLDRRRFAARLARTIRQMDASRGFVFGLHGSSGSGKSTLLNFVRHYLEAPASPNNDTNLHEPPDLERDTVLLVDFNPWWFSRTGELARSFFSRLAASVTRSPVAQSLDGIDSLLRDYADSVGGSLASFLPPHLEPPTQPDPIALRTRIAEKLAHARIVVIMDDLDRLSPDEIQQVFRLLRAVADFPNLIYLLAFDRQQVEAALVAARLDAGPALLDKVIQAPLDLPPAEPHALRALLQEGLAPLQSATPEALFDQRQWWEIYDEGIQPLVTTPRHITRYLNAVHATYPGVMGEVNAVDFFALEALRVFIPAAYEFARTSKQLLAGSADIALGVARHGEELRHIFDEELFEPHSAVLDRRTQLSARKLLSRLFPRFAWAYRESIDRGGDSDAEWRRTLRVRSPDVFETYFHFAVPAGTVSRAEMRTILSLAANHDLFSGALVELAGQPGRRGLASRIVEFLEKMAEYATDHIPHQHVEPIVSALLDIGDRLLAWEDPRNPPAVTTELHLARVVDQLLRAIPRPDERAAILLRSVEAAGSLAVPVYVAAFHETNQTVSATGPADAARRSLLSLSNVAEVREAAARKLREAASSGDLARAPRLGDLLSQWRDWSGPDAPSEFADKLALSDAGLVSLITAFVKFGGPPGANGPAQPRRPRVRPRVLEGFVSDLESLAARAEEILRGQQRDLTDLQRHALTAFLDEYHYPDNYRD